MTDEMKPVAMVRAEGLNLYYDKLHALKDVNMEVPKNSVLSLIGPSGCGKSTFLRTINRMNDLIPGVRVQGSVEVDGSDIYDPSCDVIDLRRKVGMVFQKPNPFPMSVYDNVAYGPRVHGIKDRLKKPALGISGGHQQRLCIARTLAVEPDVILMDEPTSALDPISTGKIEELVDELKKRYTIVIVTHNMQQAGRISDRTAFFLLGHVVEEGPTYDIFHRPTDKRTEDYITGRFG